ncbi:MAG: efflux RND transporter periplasmic adaptor subunit [Bacteroidales bacterium]|nr:efflux RND transporter periplasmic adaptor subunit [Bacteroidales bacterium]
MKKRIFLCCLAAIIFFGCNENGKKGTKAPTRVKTETVSLGKAAGQARNYVGIIEEKESTAVSFTGMGVVKKVYVSEGQWVAKGQVIAEMDETSARNILSAAEATKAQADDALERYGKLHSSGALTEAQWVEIQSKVAQATAEKELAQKNLDDCRLTAPVSGVIGKKYVGAGETALPSQAIVTILDVSSVIVKVSIPENEIGRIGANTASVITVEAADKKINGGIIEKGVKADAITHSYGIRIHAANPDKKLLPGMVASVSFPTGDNDYILVPIVAVQKNNNGGLFIWTVTSEGLAHRTDVSIGKTVGNSIVINEGLKQGDIIVTEGWQKLGEGTKVIF